MEKASQKSSALLDAVSTASRWSKVSKKKNSNYAQLYWIGGGVIAMILVLVLSSHHSSVKLRTPLDQNNTNAFSASLNANLARLRELASHKKSIVTSSLDTLIPRPAPRPDSKQIVARQNAPTSMYSSPASQTQSSLSVRTTQQVTFAGEGDNTNFGNTQLATTSIHARRMLHPDFTLASGEFLHAVLETAVNSDLPGQVRAVVSKPVYAYTGERVIIPAGSRLIGQYSSGIIQGQNRVMVIWQRVVLPSGIVAQLNSPGTDALGRAGQGADSVNTHFFARFGTSALLSLMGAAASTVGVSSSDQINSGSGYRMAIGDAFQHSAQQSMQGALPIKPTIQLYQGAKINVFVAHDVSFYNVLRRDEGTSSSMPSFIK